MFFLPINALLYVLDMNKKNDNKENYAVPFFLGTFAILGNKPTF